MKEDHMAEPITIGVAVITGLVGAYKAYTEYKAAVVKARAEQKAEPAKDAEVSKGEQVATVVKAAVQQHGDDKDRGPAHMICPVFGKKYFPKPVGCATLYRDPQHPAVIVP